MVDWEAFYSTFRRPGFVPGYEIQNHLGGGAFGEVYKAQKTSIAKPYAIKFLRLDEASNREAVERELDSVRLFAAIDHPNLVTIEDMGVVQEVPYLIMGYAGEDTLARRIQRGDLDGERALRYFVQACRGVLALHELRLAHFDLKPSNIFINGEAARVGDYGLAKLLAEGRQTLSFGRGTPQYMAPEMLKNRADTRADIYSLGVILFESLTGELPFGDASVGITVREDDTPPVFPDTFPAELRPIVERCLRVDPADRFQGVDQLLIALGQTSRRGDSVRMRFADLPPEIRAAQERAKSDKTPSTGELRQAAAELARGAVGVARGVWDGVVERVSTSPGESDEEPDPGLGDEVLSVSTLDDPDESEGAGSSTTAAEDPPAPGWSPSPPEAPWRRELQRARDDERRQQAPRLLAAVAPVEPTQAVTVPVPPRAEGGWVGSVTQSMIVGTEIMGALVTGPLMVALRSTAGLFDRVVRGVPTALGGMIRTLLVILVMALLGGLVAGVILLALIWGP